MADNEKVIIEVKVEGDKKASKDIDKVAKSTKNATKESKEYSKSLTENAKDVRIFGVSINSLSSAMGAARGAIRGGVTSLKLFKVALAATGIGLIIIALASLATFFTRSQEGADKFSKGLRIVTNIVNVILDRLSMLGDAIVKVFEGDFAGAAETAKAAINGVGDAILENIERAIMLENQINSLRKATIQLTVQEAAFRQQVAQNREIMNDESKSMQQRIKAGEDALNFEIMLANARTHNLQRQRDILAEGLLESETKDADRLELARLDAQLINIETARATSSIRVRNRLQALRKEAAAKEVKTEVETNDIIVNAEGMKYQQIGDLRLQDLENLRLHKQAILEVETASNEEILTSTAGLFGSIAGLLGQNSIFGKATAIAEATINSFVAGTKALASLPPPLSFLALGTAIATGLATVKRIVSVQLPQVQPVQSSFGDGGHIQGPSHKRGGVNINAEGGEYIISKDRMRIPGVRRAAMALNNFKQSKQSSYALGGFVNQDPNAFMLEAIKNIPQNILVTNDLNIKQNQSRVQVRSSTL